MMTHTHDAVMTACLNYFGGDEIAANVWMSKYALRADDGSYRELTPHDMHDRLAREFARIESTYENALSFDDIRDLFDRFRYVIPQGSPMAAIGNDDQLQSLSNCFVIESPHDSYGGIMLTDQEQAQIMKRRGGVGFDISTIRPAGLATDNAARTTDGIGVFMTRYSNTCREVAQGGRRGALMLTLDCHHPQVRTFINMKRDLTKVTGANVSLRISDEFMQAVKAGTDVQLRWPVDPNVEHAVEEMVPARELWHDIVSAARDCSEPGLLFWDTARRMTPADAYAEFGFGSISTNPCAELILSADDSCRLIVVNVASFVVNEFSDDAYFDFTTFGAVVRKAQRLMDDLVDMEIEKIDRIITKIMTSPDPSHVKMVELELWNKIRNSAVNGRRTGLGPTGVGDAIAMLNHRYGDDKSIEFVEQLYRTLACESYTSSILMAKERGHFPVWSFEKDMENEFLRRIYDALPVDIQAMWRQYGRRNIANTTTAPCGSVSVCTQTTSGIEPTIFLKYMRRKKVNDNDPGARVDYVDATGDRWMHFNIVHHGLLRWMRLNMPEDDVQRWITSSDDAGVERSPYWGAIASEIEVLSKVKIQAAAQRWLCHGVSNTANLPNDVSVEAVADLYMAAYDMGCKGVTIYREGSRDGVLIRSGEQTKSQQTFMEHDAPARPDSLECDCYDVKVKGDHWTIFVGLMDGRPYEIFGGRSDDIRLGRKVEKARIVKRSLKRGTKYDLCWRSTSDDQETNDENVIRDIVGTFDDPDKGAFTRMLSLALRQGTPLEQLVKQLQKDKDADLSSFAKVVARVLKKYIKDGTKVKQRCSACGAESLFYQEGCVTCASCGSSVCG